jgi:hypothetical protein
MIVRATSLFIFAALVQPAFAQLISPITQIRTVSGSASASDEINGFVSDSDFDQATDFALFVEGAAAQASVDGALGSGGGTQNSVINADSIVASGSHFANGEGYEFNAFGDGSGSSVVRVTFDVPVPADYSLTGFIEAFDSGDSFLTLTGPGNVLLESYFVNGPATTLPINSSGALAAGLYMLEIETSGSAFGDLYFFDFSSGAYDITLQLTSAVPSFCDASDGSLASCPCGNAGNPDTGCDIQQGTGGVGLGLVAQQTTPQNRVTWQGSGFPAGSTPTAIVIRAPALDGAAPVLFGDGLRCIGTPLVRLGAAFAVGGTSTHTHGHGAGAGSGDAHYQLWFRNTPAMFCTPDAFNLSNGRTLTW